MPSSSHPLIEVRTLEVSARPTELVLEELFRGLGESPSTRSLRGRWGATVEYELTIGAMRAGMSVL